MVAPDRDLKAKVGASLINILLNCGLKDPNGEDAFFHNFLFVGLNNKQGHLHLSPRIHAVRRDAGHTLFLPPPPSSRKPLTVAGRDAPAAARRLECGGATHASPSADAGSSAAVDDSRLRRIPHHQIIADAYARLQTSGLTAQRRCLWCLPPPARLTRGALGLQFDALKTADLSVIYDALNSMGRLAWRINDPVLQVAEEAYRRKLTVGELPSQFNLEIPEVPPDVPKNSKEYHALQSKVRVPCRRRRRGPNIETHFRGPQIKKIQMKNADLHSLRCDTTLKLSIANDFRSDNMYFPYNLDFRGRAYPLPPNLNNLGSDLCRGILEVCVCVRASAAAAAAAAAAVEHYLIVAPALSSATPPTYLHKVQAEATARRKGALLAQGAAGQLVRLRQSVFQVRWHKQRGKKRGRPTVCAKGSDQ
jgi:hypothetical protein